MHLERFPGSIRDVMQVVQMSPESLMKRGNTISLGIRSLIYKIGSSDKGCILFSLYLSIYICTLWNFVKFDILGKLFSGNIQLHRQHGMRTSFYRECWKLPKLCQFHQIKDIGDFQIWTGLFWTFPLMCGVFSFRYMMIYIVIGVFWG